MNKNETDHQEDEGKPPQNINMEIDTQGTFCEESSEKQDIANLDNIDQPQFLDENSTQDVFANSPVYEPEEIDMVNLKDEPQTETNEEVTPSSMVPATETKDEKIEDEASADLHGTSGDSLILIEDSDNSIINTKKRKHSTDSFTDNADIETMEPLLKSNPAPVQSKHDEEADDEIAQLTKLNEIKNLDDQPLLHSRSPSVVKALQPARSSPRKITKRSNSYTLTSCCEDVNSPRKKNRSASVDLWKETTFAPIKFDRKPLPTLAESETDKTSNDEDCKIVEAPTDIISISDSSSISRPSVEFVKVIRPPSERPHICPIEEETSDIHNNSQDFRLELSPTPTPSTVYEKSEEVIKERSIPGKSLSQPVVAKPRDDIPSVKPQQSHSAGYDYSDQSDSHTQAVESNIDKYNLTNGSTSRGTDQESTDSASSVNITSPDIKQCSLASKMITNMSKGSTSTPTEQVADKTITLLKGSANDITPDIGKPFPVSKLSTGKNESYRISNTTTPSTISPLQNGHSHATPPTAPSSSIFDIQISQDENGEFLSMYIVRTDIDLGTDMFKEFQRVSKRFTMDPYMGDISKSNSPSSVTSTGMLNLPNRMSFMSTISTSTSSSTRTSDGAFIIPQPPGKMPNQGAETVKGYKNLAHRVNDILTHLADTYGSDELNHSNSDEKISTGVQVTPGNTSLEAEKSNGTASPEEVNRCDRITPKSSLKKTRVKGRRPMPSKTKRALLPTTNEEHEYMHGMNSPEMVTTERDTSVKKPMTPTKEIEPQIATPKSVSKLKEKKKGRPASPRPSTPLEFKPDLSGYPPGTAVLAKWVDKRYYSGKVREHLDVSKYLIEFDDGHSKTLLDDFIIFGNIKELPLQGQSVYAMVDEDQNYEPGLVLAIEENAHGTVCYKCTTDRDVTVSVTASELYLTEDQARSLKDLSLARSPPVTPRRRAHRELDLDNIIQGPRSARLREKAVIGTPTSGRKKAAGSPRSPKASTSAGPLQLKGAAKQNIGKKNSKLTKFENDEDTVSLLGPIPPQGSTLFAGLHFLLTCTDPPLRTRLELESKQYNSEDDGESSSTQAGTDCEDLEFSNKPFNKERLKEQLEAGGGVVYSHFEDVPKATYSVCKLVAPRPCLTAKFIQCLAADIKAIMHQWVITCCTKDSLCDIDAYALPAGWSIQKNTFINWLPTARRSLTPFKDKKIMICSDNENFTKFWDRVCTQAGAITRIVNEEDLNLSGGFVVVTEWDCPHEVQNKANQDNLPLVSTTWVTQCLIEGQCCQPTGHAKYSFMYTDND